MPSSASWTSCAAPAIRPRPASRSSKGHPTPVRRLRYRHPPLTRPRACRTGPKKLERIARELEGTLFNITHEGSARIIAEHERRVAEIEALRARDGSNAEAVDRLIAQSAAVREAQFSQLRAKEVEAAEKVRAANERVVVSLEAERAALSQAERERFVAQALSRLSA
jgi:hypothetical protein